MNRSEKLFEKWTEMNEAAEMAILAYDAGRREAGMRQMKKIWQEFQILFAEEEDRLCLQDAYGDMMSLMLNRMYVELEESEKEDELWDFCRRVCELFRAGEVWREDQALYIGRFLQKQGKLEECDRWLESCRKEEPENPIYLAELAGCKVLMKKPEKALALLEDGLIQYPKCSYISRSFYRKAEALYRQLGHLDQADICCKRMKEFEK